MAKLFAIEHLQEIAVERDRPDRRGRAPPERADGAVAEGASRKRTDTPPVETIYGGTSEVQRDIIARQGLGLPRAR